jgi:hypothetical protein
MKGGAITERADQFDLVGLADCGLNRLKAYLPSEKSDTAIGFVKI